MQMTIRIISIADLKPYDNNPRFNDEAVDVVAESIKEFGFKVPIIIDKNYVIVAGHTRLKAATKLGLDSVPCVIADDLNDEQLKAFRLVDNKTHEFATWDQDKLLLELESLSMDMIKFGFDDLELAMDKQVYDDDFDEEEELPEKPFTMNGDIYVLGTNRLMCGDATIPEDVDRLVDEQVVDMIFTDPPYNVDYEGTAGKIQNDKQEDNQFYQFLQASFDNMFRKVKTGGSIYVCHADTEGINFRVAYKTAGFKLAQVLIWVKNSLVFGRQDYHWRHEPILYGWKEGSAHHFIDDRTQSTVWEYNKPKSNDLHPTMKPLELVGKAIINSSRKGDVVLDLFGGSGSTMIAATQVDRSAYLMELDEKFADVIVKRYLRHTNSTDYCYLIRDGKKINLEDISDFKIEYSNIN